MAEIENEEDKKYEFKVEENFTYLKIPTFSLKSNKDYKKQVDTILFDIDTKLSNPKIDTIVIDVRNNGGGFAGYSDNLAKLFYDKKSKYPFYPMEFRLKNTKGNKELVNKFLAYGMNEFRNIESEYKLWQKDLEEATQKGKTYTEPRAITQDFELIETYSSNFTKANGKNIIVLTNAKCYSACDLFVAIMKDQNLATKTVGETKLTGGGGANVLRWKDLVERNFVDKLPDNTDLSFAWRDMHSRVKNGTAHRKIEGKGTQVDCVIPKTIADIKEKTESLNSNYIQKVISAVLEDRCK